MSTKKQSAPGAAAEGAVPIDSRIGHPRPPSAARVGLNTVAWPLALAGIWLWTWRHLAGEWRLNEQYNYGYAVPVLAACVAWRRVRAGPTGAPAERSGPPATAFSNAAVLAGWLILLFGELLRQQDPTWRLAGGLMTLAASVLTAAGFYRWGGRELLRLMVFPVAFTWLALPWPSSIEFRLTQGLMHLVAQRVADWLNLTGVAAIAHGSVIELSRGVVGIDTACSGVESFQASLMVAVFLGELYRLKRGLRWGLVGLGWTVALLGNLVRVYLLTRAAALHGGQALAQDHDPVGYATTAVIFLAIWGIAIWMDGLHSPANEPAPPKPRLRGTAIAGWDGAALLCASALIPWVAHVWFLSVPGRNTLSVQAAPRWLLTTNRLDGGWHGAEAAFAPTERAILRFTEGEGLIVASPAGWSAQVLHLFWKPGAQVPSLAFSHTPEICMPSAGWEPIGAPAPVSVRVRGATLPCLLYRFRQGRLEQAVFHGVWYGGDAEPLGDPSWAGAARGGRLAALWNGPFHRGHEAITVYLPPAGSIEAQLQMGKEVLERVLAPVAAVRSR